LWVNDSESIPTLRLPILIPLKYPTPIGFRGGGWRFALTDAERRDTTVINDPDQTW